MIHPDNLFYNEFNKMMYYRKGVTGSFSIKGISLKTPLDGNVMSKKAKVLMRGIQDEYYKQLNDTTAILLTGCSLYRRKYNKDGFLKNKEGEVLKDRYAVPRECVAVLSNKRLGVPLKHRPVEKFDYVDYYTVKGVGISFIYIIPRKYCYRLNEVALLLSQTKQNSSYGGYQLSLQNGYYAYLQVVPYRPKLLERDCKVLGVFNKVNLEQEINKVIEEWVKSGILFDLNFTRLDNPVRGVQNLGYSLVQPTLEDYNMCGDTLDGDKEIDFLV